MASLEPMAQEDDLDDVLVGEASGKAPLDEELGAEATGEGVEEDVTTDDMDMETEGVTVDEDGIEYIALQSAHEDGSPEGGKSVLKSSAALFMSAGKKAAHVGKDVGGKAAKKAAHVGKDVGRKAAKKTVEVGGKAAHKGKEVGGIAAHKTVEVGGKAAHKGKELGTKAANKALDTTAKAATKAKGSGRKGSTKAKKTEDEE